MMKMAAAARVSFLICAVVAGLRVVVWRLEPHYWDPHGLADYVAVAQMSALLLGLSIAFGSLALTLRRSGFNLPAAALVAASLTSAAGGISNAVEDALRWKPAAWVFVCSVLLLVASVAIAGLAVLIRGGGSLLGVGLVLMAVAIVVIEPTAGIAVAACCAGLALRSRRPAQPTTVHEVP